VEINGRDFGNSSSVFESFFAKVPPRSSPVGIELDVSQTPATAHLWARSVGRRAASRAESARDRAPPAGSCRRLSTNHRARPRSAIGRAPTRSKTIVEERDPHRKERWYTIRVLMTTRCDVENGA